MPNINRTEFCGHLAADPEVKYSATGTSFCRFRLAVSHGKDEKKEVEWVSCVAFGDLAELIGANTQKGSALYVSGRQKTEQWTDKDGQKRFTTTCMVNFAALPLYKRGGNGGATNNAETGEIPF